MNKTELIVAAAERSGMTQQDIWKVMDVLPGIIQNEVAAGGKVQLMGFGTFERRFRQGRSVRNPQNGESVQTSDHYVPAFKAGKEFKEAVNKPKKNTKAAAKKKRK